uniref:ABC transporter domain-containing protein n=1 Tax=Timema bartmani TaxID=61472 RepID=A0A7R9I3P6_9NEOP|nr:unnamed protein product [Timema bartmani]
MTENFFDWTFPGVGRNIFFFYVNGIVFASILMFIEFRCFEKILYRTKLIGARLSNGPQALLGTGPPKVLIRACGGLEKNLPPTAIFTSRSLEQIFGTSVRHLPSFPSQLVVEGLHKLPEVVLGVRHVQVPVQSHVVSVPRCVHHDPRTSVFWNTCIFRVCVPARFTPTPFLFSVPEEVEEEDSDVAAERKLIRMNERKTLRMNYKLLLIDVSKFYGSFQAVDQLCVGVKRGECFGLLGVNGAGKTSTFKMLTGDEKISGGEAYVNGLSLKTSMQEVHQFSGYCPQFDALIDELTGRETLTMFYLIRGQGLCYAPCRYSGGNKRKLSTAVALVGDPPVVYLDEPTTGMDVVAKRQSLERNLPIIRWTKQTEVLEKINMEECEALCTRIAIMVNGRFKCLGSPQHLKSKFAEGYTLTIKVKPREDADGRSSHELEMAKEFVRNSFPGSLLKEEHEGLMTYHVPRSTLTWSRMFGILEDAKRRLNIEDYSLGQTSLDQGPTHFNSALNTEGPEGHVIQGVRLAMHWTAYDGGGRGVPHFHENSTASGQLIGREGLTSLPL